MEDIEHEIWEMEQKNEMEDDQIKYIEIEQEENKE